MMEKTCKLCDKPAMRGHDLCKQHHIEAKKKEWLDNTDIDNLGIVKWALEILPEFAYNKIPDFHKQLYYELLLLYNPELRNKYERLFEWISFRGSAKSTIQSILTAYVLAHNGETIQITVNGEVREFVIEERTIVIISQTSGSAEEFVVRIRDAFTESERLRFYYRVSIQDAIDSLTGQWTRTAFKLNNCFVIGIGSGQMIRGKVKGASRPTLVFADDIYSETNVITPESRIKIKKWWNNAVMNSIDDLRGKVIVLGTIVHEDTVLVELERNPLWKTIKVPLMGHLDENGEPDLTAFHKLIQDHLRIDWDLAVCVLPGDDIVDQSARMRFQREYFDKLQQKEDWELRWPERADLYFIAIKFKEAVYNQAVAGFYQEYFHIIVPPMEKRFRSEMFLRAPEYEMKYSHGYNWIKIPEWYGDKWVSCVIKFGVDLAGTGQDEAVISPIITLPDLRVIVAPQVAGKFSIRDDVPKATPDSLRRHKVVEQRSPYIERVGLVDETFRLYLRYHPSAITVGVAGEEELVVREMRRIFRENRAYTVYIQSRPQTSREGRKEQRILATLLPYYETRMVYHTPGLEKLFHQLEYLGRAKHDDRADALECAFFNVSFPEKLDLEFFEPVNKDPKLTHLEPNNQGFSLKENWREFF